ncbi:MAG: DUF4388 domain-containing protein, partial [Myxococcota bacterium]
MPKIESIRPGDTLSEAFSNYPLAELLLGILRGNLTGRLDVFLHPEARNHVHFRAGVPVVVKMPDASVSLIQVLVQRGRVPKPRGLELIRLAESSGHSVTDVLRRKKVLSPVELHRSETEWARLCLVDLFDAGPVDFRFTEGVQAPVDASMTILQPLPILYQGLAQTRDRALVRRFLSQHADARFTLAATYPSAVDPFEWGEQTEAVVQTLRAPHSVAELEQEGVAAEQAATIMTVLDLADMLEPCAAPESTSEPEPMSAVPPELREDYEGRPSAVDAGLGPQSGLVVHRRESVDLGRPVPATAGMERGESAVGGSDHDREYVIVRERLTPYFGQNYFQILRVTAGTDSAQLDRAYRFLVRRFEEEMERPGTAPVLDIVHEAYEVLKDADAAFRYAQLVERGEKLPVADRERRAFEAEPKVDRAVRAMGSGRTGEATLLLSWAERLDPSRTDLGAYFGVLDVIRAPEGQRSADAHALRGVLQEQLSHRNYDWRLKLCLALMLAEDGDAQSAARVLDQAPERSHPMAMRVETRL